MAALTIKMWRNVRGLIDLQVTDQAGREWARMVNMGRSRTDIEACFQEFLNEEITDWAVRTGPKLRPQHAAPDAATAKEE